MGRFGIRLAGQRSFERVRLRAEEGFGVYNCKPRGNLPLISRGRYGFRAHAFAGHLGLERRGDAGNSEVRSGNSDSELETLIQSSDSAGHVGLERRGDAVFREETGHEIDCQGAVRAASRIGHHPAWATLGFVPPLVRAMLGFGYPPLQARRGLSAFLLRAKWASWDSSRNAGQGCGERSAGHRVVRQLLRAGRRAIGLHPLWASECSGIRECGPSWRLGFWLAGCEPVWLCRVRADETSGRYGCGPGIGAAEAVAVR
jgi:hypothetical protein